MAFQGPLYPSTVTTAAVFEESNNDWSNPGNISADDGAEATITHATYDTSDISFRLQAANFGFTVPTGATIDGIVVEIEKDTNAGSALDYLVQLRDDTGTVVGEDKSLVDMWPSIPTISTYGSSTDTWLASPTPTMVNDPDFGLAVSVLATSNNTDIGIDFVRITVHYTEAQVFPFLDAQPGSHTLAGTIATLAAGRVVDAQPGSFALAGVAADNIIGRVLNAQSGVFSLTGVDVTLAKGFLIICDPGTYAITGVAAQLLADRILSANSAPYALTGFEAALVVPAAAFEIDAASGSLTLTGLAAGVLADRALDKVVTGGHARRRLDYRHLDTESDEERAQRIRRERHDLSIVEAPPEPTRSREPPAGPGESIVVPHAQKGYPSARPPWIGDGEPEHALSAAQVQELRRLIGLELKLREDEALELILISASLH